MIIVIPMAGKSRRFVEAGYPPKHELELGKATAFDWVVSSFRNYFDSEFVFVTNSPEDDKFVDARASAFKIKFRKARGPEQQGYASAAFKGLAQSGLDLDWPVIINPIDTFRPDFKLPDDLGNRSFFEACITGKTDERRLAGSVSRPWILKEPPSGQTMFTHPYKTVLLPFRRLTGLYYFQNAANFLDAVQATQEQRQTAGKSKTSEWKEWISVLRKVNKEHGPVRVRLVNRADVIIAGRPDEYEIVRQHWPKRLKLPERRL